MKRAQRAVTQIWSLALVLLVPLVIAPSLRTAASTAAQRPCTRGSLNLSSWRIPGTGGRSGWSPLAVDGNRVVMDKEPDISTGRISPRVLALVTAPSARYRPIPAHAYPQFGVLQRWQLDWPWLVGVFNPSPSPVLGWTLWAGNLQTGRHIVLDRGYGATSSGRIRAVPDFDLSAGTVIWTSTSYSLRRGPMMSSRLALYSLASHRAELLPIPASSHRYAHPTIWGKRIAWERYTELSCTHAHCPNSLIDLQLYDPSTHRLRTLSHSHLRTGNSFSPGLWRDDLVFLHGYDADSGGTIIVVDLSRPVPGSHRFWWQNFRFRVHQHRPEIELSVRDGFVSWDGGIADLATGASMDLPPGEEQLSGGHALVVQPTSYDGPAPYMLLRITGTC